MARRGRHQEAEKALNQSLDYTRSVLARNPEDATQRLVTAADNEWLAALAHRCGKPADAERLWRAALEIRTELAQLELQNVPAQAALCVALFLPYVMARTLVWGLADTVGYPKNPPSLPDWAERARRAHMNMVENLAPFAALVLVAQASGRVSAATAMRSPRGKAETGASPAQLRRAIRGGPRSERGAAKAARGVSTGFAYAAQARCSGDAQYVATGAASGASVRTAVFSRGAEHSRVEIAIDRWFMGVEPMASIAFMTRFSRTCCSCTESPCVRNSLSSRSSLTLMSRPISSLFSRLIVDLTTSLMLTLSIFRSPFLRRPRSRWMTSPARLSS